jgi:hypothetical protein
MDDITWPPKDAASSKRKSGTTRAKLPKPPLEVVPADDENFPGIKSEEPNVAPAEVETNTTESSTATPESESDLANNDLDPHIAAKEQSPKTELPRHRRFYFRHIHLSKKQWAIVAAILIVLLSSGVVGAKALYGHLRKTAPVAIQPKTVKKPVVAKSTTEPSRLTGLEVDPVLNKRPVTGIMIENSPDARPQSGLKGAGIVYEAIAEGGITRFLALFQDAGPQYIGPVRSVRPYYLDFLMPFDAGIAHVGGAPQALADIKSLGIKDLDQFFNSGAYDRIAQRFAPHNVYTNFAKLDALNASKGYTSSAYTSFERKKASPSKAPNAGTIDLNISGPLYNAHYSYDSATNSYKRSEGGAPHLDEKSGAQLAPSVVVALVMSRGTSGDGEHTDYTTTGSGNIYVFQDGTVVSGTWTKASRQTQFVFKNADGKPLALNPGQTWISLVDADSNIAYKL